MQLSGLEIESTELIHEKDGVALYRVVRDGLSLVAKVCEAEARAYELMASCEVPTLPTYGISDSVVLMENLATSANWRLSTEADAESTEVGTAVAEWYKRLHAAGSALASSKAGFPGFLGREYDALSVDALLETSRRLSLKDAPVWRVAIKHVDALKLAVRSFRETLTYNDFHWTNLALSRREPVQAIVFDYHLLGIGPAYCDIRNATASLGPNAREAFLEAYGPYDDSVAIIDRPLSALYSLGVASTLPRLPKWAEGRVASVTDGELESALNEAVAWVLLA